MPIVQRLIRKGVPPAVATTYMLAAPGLNPLAMFSTFLAFRNQDPWLMVVLRFGFSFLVLLFLGFWLARLRPDQMLRAETLIGPARTKPGMTPNPGLVLTPRPGPSLGGLQQFTGAVIRDFTGVLLFLVIGAAAAALFSTGFDRNLLAPIGQNFILGPLAGILLAQLLCLCSTTDAFIIAAFAPFSIPAKIAFLVAGPAHRPQALLALPQRLPGPLRPRLVVAGTCGYLSPDPALLVETLICSTASPARFPSSPPPPS